MIELVQHPSSLNKILRFDREGIQLLVVRKGEELGKDFLVGIDGVLVQSTSTFDAIETLRIIRTNLNKKQALMPVLISPEVPGSSSITHLFDGLFSEIQESVMVQRIKKIKSRLNELSFEIHELDFNQSVIRSLLQFMYSRECTLNPSRSRHSSLGFSFPYLNSVFKQEEGIRIIDVLSKAVKESYLDKKTNDYVHNCKKCSAGYLTYRECCPKCSSSDLKTDDLIHHFVCAHIAPEFDYRKEDTLECPKCDKELRHIGIDYDKPSAMHTCNDCNHQFQNAEIKALCIDCGYDNELSQLGTVEICDYKLTPAGEQIAKHGMHVHVKEPVQEKTKVVTEQIFELFRQKESERSPQEERKSWEGSIRIDLELIGQFHPDQQEIIQSEICSIISTYLNKADLLSSPSSSFYRFLVYDYETEQVLQLEDLLKNNITKLLSDGIEGSDNCIDLLISPVH